MPAGAATERAIFPLWSRSEQLRGLFDYIDAQVGAGSPLRLAGFDNQASGTLSRDSLTHDLGTFLRENGVDPTSWDEWPDFVAGVRVFAAQGFRPGGASADSVQTFVELAREALDRIEAVKSDRADATFWSLVVRGAVTRLTPGSPETRDAAMARNLTWLVRDRFPEEKIIVWAASSRIMAASDAIEELDGFVSMGSLVREAWEHAPFIIGFTALEGDILDVSNGGVLPLSEPAIGSLEEIWSGTQHDVAFLPLRDLQPAVRWLDEPMVARPLGYREVEAVWPRHFDAIVFTRVMEPSRIAPPRF